MFFLRPEKVLEFLKLHKIWSMNVCLIISNTRINWATPSPVPCVLYEEVTAVVVCIDDIQEAEEVITDASEGEIRLVVCFWFGQLKVGLR